MNARNAHFVSQLLGQFFILDRNLILHFLRNDIGLKKLFQLLRNLALDELIRNKKGIVSVLKLLKSEKLKSCNKNNGKNLRFFSQLLILKVIIDVLDLLKLL